VDDTCKAVAEGYDKVTSDPVGSVLGLFS